MTANTHNSEPAKRAVRRNECMNATYIQIKSKATVHYVIIYFITDTLMYHTKNNKHSALPTAYSLFICQSHVSPH